MWKFARAWLACGLAVVALSATDADADRIVIRSSSSSILEFELTNFYGAEGHTTRVLSFLAPSATADADLLVIASPLSPLAPTEVAAVLEHLAEGRRIAIFGDYADWSPLLLTSINTTLTSLGSAYRQTSESHAGGGTATAANGQLPAHPLTDGVSGIFLAAFGTIAGVGAGEAFLLGPDLSDVIGAEESLRGGRLVLVLDTAVAGNDQFLRNMLEPVGGTPIPEPGTFALLVAAAGLGLALRRRSGVRPRGRAAARSSGS
jgi:hypothetical protein